MLVVGVSFLIIRLGGCYWQLGKGLAYTDKMIVVSFISLNIFMAPNPVGCCTFK
jgi:hypothetical protein